MRRWSSEVGRPRGPGWHREGVRAHLPAHVEVTMRDLGVRPRAAASSPVELGGFASPNPTATGARSSRGGQRGRRTATPRGRRDDWRKASSQCDHTRWDSRCQVRIAVFAQIYGLRRPSRPNFALLYHPRCMICTFHVADSSFIRSDPIGCSRRAGIALTRSRARRTVADPAATAPCSSVALVRHELDISVSRLLGIG